MSIFKLLAQPEAWFAEHEELDKQIREKGMQLRGREDELLHRPKTDRPQLMVDNDKKKAN